MSAIYIMLPASLLLAGLALAAYIWSVRSGQYEDTQTPAMRILPEEGSGASDRLRMESQNPGKPT